MKMKGVVMNLVIAGIIALVTILIAFSYWTQVKDEAQKAAPRAMSVLIGGFALFDFNKYPRSKNRGVIVRMHNNINCIHYNKKRKGISEATTLVLVVTMAVLVAFVIFALYGGISSEAGPAASGLQSEFFDAIIRNLPGG